MLAERKVNLGTKFFHFEGPMRTEGQGQVALRGLLGRGGIDQLDELDEGND
jgi:hypothetical protein